MVKLILISSPLYQEGQNNINILIRPTMHFLKGGIIGFRYDGTFGDFSSYFSFAVMQQKQKWVS